MANYGTPGEEDLQENPIVQTGSLALENNNFFFKENPEKQYVGLYHKHQDGTLMIGEGVLGIDHDIISSEIIFQKVTYASIQQTREVVSDLFYKIWFESDALTNEDIDILSMQTTIRDGIKQTGRTEDEPLVFYKKDRNTLESRKDLQGDTFEQMCQYIFENEITNDLENKPSNPPEGYEVGGAMSPPILMSGTPSIGGQWLWNGDIWNRIIGGRLEELFSIPNVEPVGLNTTYKIVFNHDVVTYEIIIAEKLGDVFTNVLNLSQLTKTKTGSKIDPEKASEVLDTDIFELLPNQTTRQDTINRFFKDFDLLVGDRPTFTDENDDGFPEFPGNYDADERSRISVENPLSTASITRLDIQANTINETKTLQSMRNKLNEFLKDADSRLVLGDAADAIDGVTQTVDANGNIIYRYRLQDLQPEYENKSNGFLKIRKPNQAIIIRGQNNNLLEFQKEDSYLTDGFTITMWVRFVDKQSSGTLFNFGNPLEEDGEGFRLETNVTQDSAGKNRRTIRLVIKDENNLLRDNHWGSSNKARIFSNTSSDGLRNNFSPLNRYPNHYHTMYPEIPTDDLNEWYFICATYNPEIREPISTSADSVRLNSKDYWLNHRIKFNTPAIAATSNYWINIGDVSEGDIVANSLEGAKCKVEIISRTDLLKARGYKVDDISVTTPPVDDNNEEDFEVTEPPLDPDLDVNNTQEETSNIEPEPIGAPDGFDPTKNNFMTGTLSPRGQWKWNGISAWVAVEIEEEEETEEEDPFFNDGDTSESDADNEDNKNVEIDKSLTDVETDDFDDGLGGY